MTWTRYFTENSNIIWGKNDKTNRIALKKKGFKKQKMSIANLRQIIKAKETELLQQQGTMEGCLEKE